MKKLAKSTLPDGHSPHDFKCFGPPANKDGEFSGTKIADFGCFTQDGKDSNKYYHAAICQSKKDSKWYIYVQWGRVGQGKFDHQFFECSSESEAQKEFEKQCHSKNDKRGEWFQHKSLGKILRAKAGKDCYLVRNMATRVSGLPDACQITTKKAVIKSKSTEFDPQTSSLLRDLKTGTVTYTRSQFASGMVPDLSSIEEARKILAIASKSDKKELEELTKMLYSKIPKSTVIGNKIELSNDNIKGWLDDLDAFESAFNNLESGTEELNIKYLIKYVNDNSVWDAVAKIVKSSTRNRHSYLNKAINILHIWEITNVPESFIRQQELIAKEYKGKGFPLIFQPERNQLELKSNCQLLFHGSRTVNIGSILMNKFKTPKELSGVSINGAINGPAIYHASDYKKSCGYCSIPNAHWSGGSGTIKNRGAFMFLNDVILGNPHIISRPYPHNNPPDGYHSVIADTNGSFLNEEFMVYSSELVYPRFLLEFDI